MIVLTSLYLVSILFAVLYNNKATLCVTLFISACLIVFLLKISFFDFNQIGNKKSSRDEL